MSDYLEFEDDESLDFDVEVGTARLIINADIIDNLESDSKTDALSANQGRVLKEMISETENVIEGVKVNGVALEPIEKVVDIKVPTRASDIHALPDYIKVPYKLSDLTEDTTHRTVTDTEKTNWNGKANASDIYLLNGDVEQLKRSDTIQNDNISNLDTSVGEIRNSVNWASSIAMASQQIAQDAQTDAQNALYTASATMSVVDGLKESLIQFKDDGYLPKNLFNEDDLLGGYFSTSGYNSTAIYSWAIMVVPIKSDKMVLSGFPSDSGAYSAYLTPSKAFSKVAWGTEANNGVHDIDTSYQYIGICFRNNNASGFPNKMIAYGTDATYVPYAPSNTELKKSLTELMPTGYKTDGLTFTNCGYVAGGYFKIGNMVVVNIRVLSIADASSASISGLPSSISGITRDYIPLNIYVNSTDNPRGYINTSGVATLQNIGGSKTYYISAMYLTN